MHYVYVTMLYRISLGECDVPGPFSHTRTHVHTQQNIHDRSSYIALACWVCATVCAWCVYAVLVHVRSTIGVCIGIRCTRAKNLRHMNTCKQLTQSNISHIRMSYVWTCRHAVVCVHCAWMVSSHSTILCSRQQPHRLSKKPLNRTNRQAHTFSLTPTNTQASARATTSRGHLRACILLIESPFSFVRFAILSLFSQRLLLCVC